jgi:hypothetical protein
MLGVPRPKSAQQWELPRESCVPIDVALEAYLPPVNVYGARADLQVLGDGLARQAFLEKFGHVLLPLGEERKESAGQAVNLVENLA